LLPCCWLWRSRSPLRYSFFHLRRHTASLQRRRCLARLRRSLDSTRWGSNSDKTRGGANPLLVGGCEWFFCRLFGNFAESLAYSKCACLKALYYLLLLPLL
jgi:hypothetical protein